MSKEDKRHKTKNREGGRKSIVIDWGKVDTYLMAGCDGASVARLMGMHPDTLYNQVKRVYGLDFSAYRELKKVEGVSLMEGSMFRDALEHGGVDRMFWLKAKANWKDRQEVDVTSKGQKIGDLNITVDDPATAAALKVLLGGKKA
jgi:hypothetical protein